MADFEFSGAQSGASAATNIINEVVPFNMELEGVSALSTAATSSAVALDVLKNGTSVFGTNTALGTVFQGTTAQGSTGGITSTSQTSFDFAPAGKPIEANTVITIDSEQMIVTKVDGSATQSPTGVGVQKLTVTRAAFGTTAATHTAGTTVYPTKPTIANGGTQTQYQQLPVSIPFNVGDTLTVVGATGATNLSVAVQANRL
jgi:hypothetical protein